MGSIDYISVFYLYLEYTKKSVCGIRRSLYGVIARAYGRKKADARAICGERAEDSWEKNFLWRAEWRGVFRRKAEECSCGRPLWP